MIYESFCGGIFETNCYLVQAPEGGFFFDAPYGACACLESLVVNPTLMLLTHGHFDHIPDVAKIKRRFGCPIGCHRLTAPMISDPEFFRGFGFELEIEPVEPDFFVEETPARKFLGLEMQVLEVPGHCPEVFASSRPKTNCLSAECLFAGSVGRGIFPAAIIDLLDGIGKKVFPLGDNVQCPRLPTEIGTGADDPFVAKTSANQQPTEKSPSSASSSCRPSICSTTERKDVIAAGT
jgi:glyoxylase-like metal-dependent hydrolase (beta-lactamase superfamily II)